MSTKGTVLGVAAGAGLVLAIKAMQSPQSQTKNVLRYSLNNPLTGLGEAGVLALKKEGVAFVIRDAAMAAWIQTSLSIDYIPGPLPAGYKIVGVLSSIPVSQERIDYWKTLTGGTWVV